MGKASKEEIQEKRAELKEFSNKVKELTEAFKEIEGEWFKKSLLIPSIPLDETPVGKDDSENVEIRVIGEKTEFSYDFKDHVALGESLGLIDIERGVKIAGARSYFLTGDGARLQHAVLQFAKDLLYQKNYKIMDCPHLVNYEAMQGTSYFPGGEDMAYHLDERDPEYYLIGTSEVPVCSYHSGEVLKREELPKRYAGYSPCYRREAGTYGKDTHGLYRIHQFYKVEQVVICEASVEESEKMHSELLNNAEDLMKALELPYRVVEVCTGDMGQGQVFKHDIEAWMPSRNSYGETHSCSTFYDFQSRRLNISYKDENGKKKLCHTLNNTLVATPRILIPIIENNQTEDGRIKIPKVLQKYMLDQEFIG
ncbi:UNVERIFIED_CONTAM: hypothetical protein GTU68_048764 [Idotea baltica]|nr:hypothetical protein [Idotea baltica]